MKLLPSTQMNAMAFQAYDDFMKENSLASNSAQKTMLNKVGSNISSAMTQFLKQNKMEDRVKGFEWEFNLVDDPQVNAWAMPGGKVVFYSGIMEICDDEESIAVVMGHEIAHIIAKHGNERMSQGLLTQAGGLALAVAMEEKPEQTQQIFMAAYGLGSQVGVLLPYSRVHEKEADRIGLIAMAMAGYNPERAITFWEEMEAMSNGNQPPEFLSTHPNYGTRIQELRKHMPEAKKYYNASKGRKSSTSGNKKTGGTTIKVKTN
jgi:predicted Zn-dependent protease